MDVASVDGRCETDGGTPRAADFARPRRPVVVGAVIVALLAVVVAGIMLALRPPAPVGAQASENEFSAGRAFAHVPRVAAAPHPVGSAEHDRVRRYLVDQLQRLGLQVRQVYGTA